MGMKTSVLLSLLVFYLILSFAGSRSVIATKVQEICAQTRNPPACQQVLNSDPRSGTDDLELLTLIALQKTQPNLTAIVNKVKSLLAQTKGPSLERPLNECLEIYDADIFDCRRAVNFLVFHDYYDVNDIGSAISNSGPDCERTFGSSPSPLTAENNYAVLYGDIILSVSSMLLDQ